MLVDFIEQALDFIGPARPVLGFQAKAVGRFRCHIREAIAVVFKRVVEIFELVVADTNFNAPAWHSNHPLLYGRLSPLSFNLRIKRSWGIRLKVFFRIGGETLDRGSKPLP